MVGHLIHMRRLPDINGRAMAAKNGIYGLEEFL